MAYVVDVARSINPRPSPTRLLLSQSGRNGEGIERIQKMRQRLCYKYGIGKRARLSVFTEGYHDDWQLVVELTIELEAKRRMEQTGQRSEVY